ncbi:MAG TPA: hypothetical protein PLI09_23740 [Candidatus Hydrogenedentes bacterium]|nr:hypothetical protein [Candidatus Hydrogenedentota bacterium]
MIHEIILWMGRHFSPEQYLFWTRIQCFAWTCADLVIVFYMLQIANLARAIMRRRIHRIPYILWGVSMLSLPCILAAGNGMQIFRIEIIVTIPHFLIILYVIGANTRIAPAALQRIVKPEIENS